jgi:hypothetical protein
MNKLATVMTVLVMLGVTAVANTTGSEFTRKSVSEQISSQIDLSELKEVTSAREIAAGVLFTIDANGAIQVMEVVSTDAESVDYIRQQLSELNIDTFGLEVGKEYMVKLRYRIL